MESLSTFFIRFNILLMSFFMSGAIVFAQADNSPTTGTTGPPTQDQIIQRAGNINNQPVGDTTGPPTPTQVQNQSGTNNASTAGSTTTSNASGGSYTPIEDVPGFEGQSQSFPQYIRNIYILAMWLAGISALVMITIGGFWYMTSAGNTSRMNTAKGIITDAIIGLVLMLTAWLILNTINPDLTRVNLTGMTSTPITGAGSTPSVGCGKIVEAGHKEVDAGCKYDQAQRNSCSGTPGYTDCSQFASDAYRQAGCKVPPNTTAAMVQVATVYDGNQSGLKAGDILVYNTGGEGHAVLCENDGCSTLTQASGHARNLVKGDNNYVVNGQYKSILKVIRASDYCSAAATSC